ncbi:PHP domain protein [Dehalogenimonas lykanthroporepellens BL-DC-9]|jgi:predicted metal-dependent phosphoesterase TrpH|nr:PHP domain protein [Dehalogenimonas lykanthroporepellens BL-DC-9]
MTGKIDLHVHSNASDGVLSPAEVVRKAVAQGVTYLALTDHDTVFGIEEAVREVRRFQNLTFIPGVEISTDVEAGDVHILGYFVDWKDTEFISKLQTMRESRVERGQAMVSKLSALGMPLDWGRIQKIAGDAVIGRPHIAQAMLEKSYINNFSEAFEKYLGRGKPAYAERIKLTPEQAVELIISAGGLPVMAHPFTLPGFEQLVLSLVPKGLAGIETYYASYSVNEIEQLKQLADRLGLVATGGTDFHGLDPITEIIIGGQHVPIDSVRDLLARRAVNNK